MNIQINGLDSLMKKLNAIGGNSDEVLQEGLMLAGKQVQTSAKSNCPVNTGQLRNSIEVKPIENGVSIGTNVEYAICVEYGTGSKGSPEVAHTTKEKWVYKSGDKFFTTRGNKPQPFLHPALNQNRNNIGNIIKATFRKALQGKG